METIQLQEKIVKTALCQFIFPFSFKGECYAKLKETLLADGFTPFYLDKLELQDAYYGEGYHVSHPNMERYYLPYTGSVLFPYKENPEAFQRYSKALNLSAALKTNASKIPFVIHSVDVTICPFDLGFITIRTQIAQERLTFSGALEFADRFRVLQDISKRDNLTFIHCDGEKFKEVESFIFNKLVKSVLPYLDKSGMEGAYFETLPFFVDERMYVQAVYAFEEGTELDETDFYRAVHLDGVNMSGRPIISSSNMEYVRNYIDVHGYNRWLPHTLFMVNEHSFCCLTSSAETHARKLGNQMYGEYYYGLLLNLFHKIVLLKLSNRYSQVDLRRSNEEVSRLIRQITTFSSKYFFIELVSQSQGREIFIQLRKIFRNNELYIDVKQTLADLFKYQDAFSNKRQSYLLAILTIYTVVSGIFGMNQVIEDLKGPMDFSKIKDYSVFEYIAMFTTFSGLFIAFLLGFGFLLKWIKDKKNDPV